MSRQCLFGRLIGEHRAIVRLTATAVLSLLLSACASTVHLAVDQQALDFGLQRLVVEGQPFRHVVYRPHRVTPGRTLHVYIEGDGVPWRQRTVIASDPTAFNNLMLRLMDRDPGPAIYVGRPCYFGLARDADCNPDVWTFSRYSRQVVDSMAAAIARQADGFDQLVLLGHSGGGALAMMLAEQLRRVSAVVTVAGNLNVDGWTSHHSYTPLHGSLDPSNRPPLPARIRQLHLLGERDRKIPPTIVESTLRRQSGATVWRFERYTHGCCWSDIWPDVLRWLRNEGSTGQLSQKLSGIVGDHAIHTQFQ